MKLRADGKIGVAECSEREERCERADWREERGTKPPGSLPDAVRAITKFLIEKQHAFLYVLG